MTISFTKKLALSVGFIAGLSAAGATFAHEVANEGYLNDTRGNVVKNNYKECWRTGYWTPAMATAECDPDLVKKGDAKKPATRAVADAGPDAPAIKASFKAETLFDFNKADVKAEGQAVMNDKIVAGMKAHPEVELLLVTGHTDRIGSDKYNQKLSEKRAEAVKAYLVKQGVDAKRIKAVGMGESTPNPDADTKGKCKGNKKTKALIECLQPDRRVTVVPEIQIQTKK